MYRIDIKQYITIHVQHVLSGSYASFSQSARYSAIVSRQRAPLFVTPAGPSAVRLGSQHPQYTHVLTPIQRDLTLSCTILCVCLINAYYYYCCCCCCCCCYSCGMILLSLSMNMYIYVCSQWEPCVDSSMYSLSFECRWQGKVSVCLHRLFASGQYTLPFLVRYCRCSSIITINYYY